MKKLFVMMLVSTNVMALDFDTEWAKFNKDFVKLKEQKVTLARIETVPNNQPQVEVIDRSLPAKNTASNIIERVDPKSTDRLGLKLENKEMREKLKELYSRSDIVVYSLTLE